MCAFPGLRSPVSLMRCSSRYVLYYHTPAFALILVCAAVARYDGMRGPDDGGHCAHDDAHLGPPPEPHGHEQVRGAFSITIPPCRLLLTPPGPRPPSPVLQDGHDARGHDRLRHQHRCAICLPPPSAPSLSSLPDLQGCAAAAVTTLKLTLLFPGAVNWSVNPSSLHLMSVKRRLTSLPTLPPWLQHCAHLERRLRESESSKVVRTLAGHTSLTGARFSPLVDRIHEPLHLRLAPLHPRQAYVPRHCASRGVAVTLT